MQLNLEKSDPLLFDLELPLHALIYPLGFAVEIATNSSEVLEAARESWGRFHQRHTQPALQMRVGLTDGGSAACPPPPIWRGNRHLLTQIADAQNFAVCDSQQGLVLTWLTRAAIRNRAYLRYHFIEGTVWVMLECAYLASMHAACVGYRDCGVLLCGDSGAGKSSLAYACARHGWTFLSDDSSYLIRGREGRLVAGNPFQMRFRTSALELFPELKNLEVTPRLDGEMAIELVTASMPEIATATECKVNFIVFLNRDERCRPALVTFPFDQAIEWFQQFVCFGEVQIREEQRASLRQLLAAKTFELRYQSLDWAVQRLEALVLGGAAIGYSCIEASQT